MPSYPDSVKSFTAKTAGQNIDPAHVNDIQDEVNAIEAGLRNGTAPLNSSGSTMTRLHVTGASTFASGMQSSNSTLTALQVSSNSTFALRPTMPPPDMALVFAASTGTIGSSANSTLSFLGQDIATNSSIHSTGTNPERLTPQSTGVYQFTANVAFPTPSSFTKTLQLRDSTATAFAESQSNSTLCRLQIVGYKRYDVAGGWVTLSIANSEASSLSISSGSGVTWFAMEKL